MPRIEPFLSYLPGSLRERVADRPNLWRIVANVGWLFADRIVRLGVGLLVSVWIARYLGREQFGLFNYAIAYAGLFLPLAMLGIDSVMVRDLVREPAAANELLGTAFTLKLLAGTVTYAAALAIVLILKPDDASLHAVVSLAATVLVFQAFEPVDGWFQSQVRAKYSVVARNLSFLVATVARIVLIVFAANVVAFAAAIAFEGLLSALGLVIAYRVAGGRPTGWRATRHRAATLLATGWPLMFSGLAVAVYVRIDQIMIGEILGDEGAVGIYAAAARISEVWYIIPTAVVSSVVPALLNAKATDTALYERRMQKLLQMMALIGYAVAIPVSLLSGPVIWVLYGAEYSAAAPVLAIHIWAGLFVCLGVAQTAWLLNEGHTRVSMVNTMTGAALNCGLNWLLIPRHGPVGAAIATLLSYAVAVFAFSFVYRPTRSHAWMTLKALVFRS